MGQTSGRVSRLLSMAGILESGDGWDAGSLARRFGISRTRVYNDIRVLREAGVPIQCSTRGYRIDSSHFLSSVHLTPREVLSLLVPLQCSGWCDAEYYVQRGAREKLTLCLRGALREGARQLLRHTSVVIPSHRTRCDVLSEIREAVVERRRIVMICRDGGGAPERMQIDPYGMAYREFGWHVLGYSVTHREVRGFCVSRIAAVERTPLHFTVPSDFSVDACLDGPRCGLEGTRHSVRVRFSPRAAPFVKECGARPGQRIRALSDGTILYDAVVDDLDEVARWVMQYGGEAVVERPQELKDVVILRAADILGRYLPAGPTQERPPRSGARAGTVDATAGQCVPIAGQKASRPEAAPLAPASP